MGVPIMMRIFPMEQSPFEAGEKAFSNGGSPPAFPRPDDSWASRLYFRGWDSAARKKCNEEKAKGSA